MSYRPTSLTRHHRAHRLAGAAAALSLFLVAAILPAAVLPAAAPAYADLATLTEIEKAVGVDDIPADYIILADTSGSMAINNQYAALKNSLRAYLAALAPADQLTLISFDSTARVVYQGRVGESPDDIIAKLPATASGTATDIGTALEQAVAALGRANAPSIASVVLITDGRHDPPIGSHYPKTDGWSWRHLHDEVQVMRKQSLQAYALPLGRATGAGLLGSVIDRPKTLDAESVGQVTRLLDVPKREARAAKVRSALAGETGKGVEVVWSPTAARLQPGDNRVDITVRSTTARIPLQVDGMSLTSGDPAFHVHLRDASIALAPGASARIPAVISWAAGARSFAYHDRVAGDPPLTLAATVTTPWAETLRDDLGIDFVPSSTGSTTTGHGSANLGRTWVYHLGVLILLVFIAALGWGAYRRPLLFGRLRIGAPGHVVAREVYLPRRRSTTLGPADTGERTPIRVRMVRVVGVKQLALEVDSAALNLRSGVERTHRGVRFEWAAAAFAPSPPAASQAHPLSTTPTAAPTMASPAPITPKVAPGAPSTGSSSTPVVSGPQGQPAPTPSQPTAQHPAPQHSSPHHSSPQHAAPHHSSPHHSAPQHAAPVQRIDAANDDELPVIDDQAARID